MKRLIFFLLLMTIIVISGCISQTKSGGIFTPNGNTPNVAILYVNSLTDCNSTHFLINVRNAGGVSSNPTNVEIKAPDDTNAINGECRIESIPPMSTRNTTCLRLPGKQGGVYTLYFLSTRITNGFRCDVNS